MELTCINVSEGCREIFYITTGRVATWYRNCSFVLRIELCHSGSIVF